jgi:hypothetical protein
LLQQPG